MAPDLDTYREESLRNWRQIAAGWERRREWLRSMTGDVADWLVRTADPQAGQTALEIAGGTGDLSLRLAERVGDEGRVIFTDFAPEMVESARRLGEERHATNVDYRVLDAERMDLGDDSVDVATCRYGYMLMADPAAALAETRRVLKDGGRLAFAVWMTPDRNPWAAIPGMTLVQRGHVPPPEPGAPGIFAMGDPDRIRQLVTGAGFAEPELEEITFEFRYTDPDDLWDSLVSLAGPLAKAINDLSPDELEATREAILENVASFRQEDGTYVAPAATWGVLTH